MDRSSLPDPGEWDEDWYTTWQSRKENPNALLRNEQDEVMSSLTDHDDVAAKGRRRETPEVGTICTVRLQIGESVSRIHPYLTSHLRHSKWKRKYLASGMFSHR
jgi:hypothetical protein